MWKTSYFLSGNSWTSLRKQVKHYIFLLKLRGNGNFHLFTTFLCPFSLSLFFAGVSWQMTSGTKALALKNGNAFASREGALLCSAGADTARLFRHLNKSVSPKEAAQPQAGCVKHRCLTDIERQRCLFLQVVGRQSFWDLLQDLSESCEVAGICLRHARAESRHTWCVCGIFGITIKALCKAARMHERHVRIRRIADFVMRTFISRKEKAASWWQKCGIMVR